MGQMTVSCFLSLCLLLTGYGGIQESSSAAPESQSNVVSEGNASSAVLWEVLSDAKPPENIPLQPAKDDRIDGQEEITEVKLKVQVGIREFSATLEDNAAADAFTEMLKDAPVTISMRDYSGFEKVGSLGSTLPADDQQITARPGDIVLYTGNQIVMFYGSNSWSYTRLGRIDDLSDWKETLGIGDVSVTFSVG